ncbi:hypothetical protein [Actinoplanes regularis]|uniref:hypothetical protein n=1 Tax=Actinoplanes regularis TaxID=52697 RepID=UPI0024A5140F|nr:hypothetical protein [Actinoplanes regularis]GLW32297.1 hypothetical protein Areg01_52360 [Actinoplanes regularis]
MGLIQRHRDRKLLNLVEEGKQIGFPVEEFAAGLPEIGKAIQDAQRRKAEREAKKKR